MASDAESSRAHAPFWDNVANLVTAGIEKYPPDAGTEWMGCGQVYLTAALSLTAEAVAIELGCGPGFTLEWLAKQCRLAVGIDFSRGQLRLASKRIGSAENVQLICHNLNFGLPNVPLKATHFFSIYGAMDFVASPSKLLVRCIENLNPGGMLVIATSRSEVKALRDSSLPLCCVCCQSLGGGRELLVLRREYE